LAHRYGITGRGLAKACQRADVPVPPRAYWAKLQAGRAPARPKLPPLKRDAVDCLEVSPRPPKPEKPPLSPEAKAAVEEENRPERKIVVPQQLRRPHHIVQRWIRMRRRDRSSPFLVAMARGSPRDRDLDRRRDRILSTLFREIEKRGYSVRVDETRGREMTARLGIDEMPFTLDEHIRQYRRDLTPEERASPWHSDRHWAQVKEPTGELMFRIRSPWGVVSEWRDEPGRPIEEQLNDIIAGFAVRADELRHRRLEEAEKERKQIASGAGTTTSSGSQTARTREDQTVV
jgi:hypothetical protein